MFDHFVILALKGLINLYFLHTFLIIFLNWRGYVDNCLGCHCLRRHQKRRKIIWAITWKSFMRDLLSRDNFLGDNCLGVIINGQLFCGTIVWSLIALIVQGLILWRGTEGRGLQFYLRSSLFSNLIVFLMKFSCSMSCGNKLR